VRSWQARTSALAATVVVIAACAVPGGASRGSSASRLSAVVYERGGDLYAVAVDGSRTVRLTRTRLRELDPAVSPDGSKITYVRDRGDYFSGALSVMRLDGSHRRILDDKPDKSPAWSPDGRTIFFVREVARGPESCGELARASVTGGRARLIRVRSGGASDMWPAVSPDGQRIAFTAWDFCSGGTASPWLRVVDTSGQPTRDLTRLPHNGRFPNPEHSCPAWSPTGRQIAFLRNSDLTVANRDGSAEHRVARGGHSLIYRCPSWSPDGRWIAFSTEDARGGPVLLVVHPDGTGARRLRRATSVDFTIGGWLPSLPR
jgi:dipeptidyl aminopeptidase/acylaminoacyl peptidase